MDQQEEESSTKTITTIGIDIAKSVFQLHGVNEVGNVILHKKLRRSAVLDTFRKPEPCLVGMEACATEHYWPRSSLPSGMR